MSAAAQLHNQLIARGQTLSLAESCTGGLLSAALTSLSGASKHFLGSVVSYHQQVKCDLLGVPSDLIHQFGEVSEPVAKAMAEGARKFLKSDWSIAVTGVAGPTGGTKEKPVGLVCFSVCGSGVCVTEMKLFGSVDRKLSRSEIQALSVEHSIQLLLKHLK